MRQADRRPGIPARFESHPLGWLFNPYADRFERDPRWSYFRTTPEESQGWPEVYIGNLGRDESTFARKYERLWPVSTIINSLIDAGLRLDRFSENPNRPFSYSPFPNIPDEEVAALPQSYSLWMTKPAT